MHGSARLTERTRRELVGMVGSGVPVSVAATRFGVSRPTVYRWLGRAHSGKDGWWKDRSSRPRFSPNQINADIEQRIVELRQEWGLGPVRIGAMVGVASSTVWRALSRHSLNRKPVTPRQYQARYERGGCGDLIHIDTKRAGRIPEGGGRFVRGIAGYRTETRKRTHTGHVWFHAAVDDHSRLAYVEVLNSRTGNDTAAFTSRAVAWFQQHGITVTQIMTDNAFEYVHSQQFHQSLGPIQHITTRPYRPQTNGKVERFFRTLKDEYMYALVFRSEQERQHHLTNYLHYYNWHRPHTAIGNQPPITRVNNLPKPHR